VTEIERRDDAAPDTPEQVTAALRSIQAQTIAVRDPVEAIHITKRADSIKYLADKADLSAEVQNEAAEVALRARRKAGELIAAIPRESGAGGGRPSETSGQRGQRFTEKQKVLEEADLPERTANRFEQLARIPEAEFEDHVTGTRADDITPAAALRKGKEADRQAKRDHNQALIEETAPLPGDPDTRYPVVVIDPPWDWGDEGDVDQFGRAAPTYKTMSYDQLTEFPVGEQADSNAHLYLWITNRSLPKGFGLLEAWGFRYVTMLTWCKPHFGMGNYYRGQTEHVLFGVRGSLPLLRNDRGTWFEAKRPGRHSAKPDEFYELVEECSPGPWLEIFSRSARPGWSAWGAEAQ